ncbi:MAG: acyl-CoA thioesterase [Acidimicrobiia bacterium]|nr:acyl-CoA thioesterase [Acidimicrobiia bacterium]
MTEHRDGYPHHLPITTRWSDNDAYNHLNNVVYYSFFDTVINDYLVKVGGLDIATSPIVGVTVESHCEYRSSIAFPDAVVAGLRVAHLGNSSVRYEVGIFRGDEGHASAHGHFVHVFVDRATMKPAPVPAAIRTALEAIAT